MNQQPPKPTKPSNPLNQMWKKQNSQPTPKRPMNTNLNIHKAQKSLLKDHAFPRMPKQALQPPKQQLPQQIQIRTPNARINSARFAQANLAKRTVSAFKATPPTVAATQKSAAQIKAKLAPHKN